MGFYVGQEVVSIVPDDDWFCHREWPEYWPETPKPKVVYHVREIYIAPSDGAVGLRLDEIVCGIHPISGIELGWAAEHFRPVVKTDISELEEIARKITQGERVTA